MDSHTSSHNGGMLTVFFRSLKSFELP